VAVAVGAARARLVVAIDPDRPAGRSDARDLVAGLELEDLPRLGPPPPDAHHLDPPLGDVTREPGGVRAQEAADLRGDEREDGLGRGAGADGGRDAAQQDCSSASRRRSRSSGRAWRESPATSSRPAKMIAPTTKKSGTTMRR